ncbi:glycoside hydrolase family 15 protein [Georgenia sp. SYP-B2076]|uniref:glycoside hydrolase family 15 protein n=1 Tax=Georgenia sp. SYP-B2076 TaxID=2495881 RepID=UPI003517DEB1
MPPRGATPHVVRLVQGLRGTVQMFGELRLRFDYGHVVPWARKVGGAIEAVAGPDAAWLRTPAPLRQHGDRTVCEFVVHSGQTVPFVLTWAPSHLPTPDPLDPEQALRDTVDFWAGYVEEATSWREWLLRAVAGDPGTLQIMYGLDGTRRLPEVPLPWLASYESSTPVRTGNAAAGQLQLDVWGEVLDGLHLARQANMRANDDAWDLQVALMDHLESHWRDPDNGLWELRGPRRHLTHSKVMTWVAADRMARAARDSRLPGPMRRWQQLRDDIHSNVLRHGYNDERGTFVQSYGGSELDARLLLIPRVGFLPGTDCRVLGTIDAIQRELTQDGFVLRYRTDAIDDGLPAGEGVFLACSFWLVDAQHYARREHDAIALLERLLSLRNDVGLLSEEWDPGRVASSGTLRRPGATSPSWLVNSSSPSTAPATATNQ